eukprot:GHVU01209319.1.p1 GENE.GHVU01209319.1~~GHVU01209319.1.p1  ORF type:complete len:336 (+),score=62.38 GHVU01209319.1:2532-3539(+)
MAKPMESLEEIAAVIGAGDGASIEAKARALFSARHHGGEGAARALMKGLDDKSVFLRHEIAYVLGQVGHHCCVPILKAKLEDVNEDPIVRHEAAEALGAIGAMGTLSLLEKYCGDESTPVRQTCELAVASLKEQSKQQGLAEQARKDNPYNTVDPLAPEDTSHLSEAGRQEVENRCVREVLDEKAGMVKRYKAMMYLRNRGTKSALDALCKAISEDTSSALFRHEVAFVLGQMQSLTALACLEKVLRDSTEHPMARHEAALAVGAVGVHAKELLAGGGAIDSAEEGVAASADAIGKQDADHVLKHATALLKEFSTAKEEIVLESCLVGLDNIANA